MTVSAITLRGMLGARRTWALGALSVLTGLLAFLIRRNTDTVVHLDRYAEISESLIIPTVVAFVALVLGASTVSDEREEWTIFYFMATPLSRVRLMGEWVIAAWVASLAMLVPAFLGAAALGLSGEMGVRGLIWLVISMALVALVYCAVAGLLALLTRRAIIIGMLYIVLWEGSVASFAASADRLSLGAYGRRLLAEGVPGAKTFQVPDINAVVALIVLLAVSATAVWLGGRRLSSMELP